MRKLVYLIVVIVALGLILAGCIPTTPPVEQDDIGNLTKGTTMVYPGDSIQDAIDAASNGDTITVAPGTYYENIIIDKSLAVRSTDGAFVTIIDADLADFGVLIIEAGTVATFDGFTVKNYERAGILAGAFSLENDPTEVHILNNIVTAPGALVDQNNNCIQVGDGTTGTIIGNEVNGANLVHPDWSGSGILVAGSSNVLVSNNYAYDCDLGIAVVGYAVNRVAPSENNLVENNLVENNVCGISIQMNSIGTIIEYNDVFDNEVGIESAGNISWEPTIPSDTEIHYNNIVGNAVGVASIDWNEGSESEQVDATCNWWGNVSGPYNTSTNFLGLGNTVSKNVDFSPWLLSPAPEGSCFSFDDILACAVDVKNHGEFVSRVSHLTKDWLKAGFITAEEKGAITKWAAKSDIGKK